MAANLNVLKIQLPSQFLPCVDDPHRLRAIADFVGERGDARLERHLRWTANAWEWRQGLPRHEINAGDRVWARYFTQGWSRAVVIEVTERVITVAFPHRRSRRPQVAAMPVRNPVISRSTDTVGQFAFGTAAAASHLTEQMDWARNATYVAMRTIQESMDVAIAETVADAMEVWQTGERAWWDLVPRNDLVTKPHPRKGWGATTNARLAKALTTGLEWDEKTKARYEKAAKIVQGRWEPWLRERL